MKINCAKCGYNEIQSEIHLHHLVPKSIGGIDSDGRKYFCKNVMISYIIC